MHVKRDLCSFCCIYLNNSPMINPFLNFLHLYTFNIACFYYFHLFFPIAISTHAAVLQQFPVSSIQRNCWQEMSHWGKKKKKSLNISLYYLELNDKSLGRALEHSSKQSVAKAIMMSQCYGKVLPMAWVSHCILCFALFFSLMRLPPTTHFSNTLGGLQTITTTSKTTSTLEHRNVWLLFSVTIKAKSICPLKEIYAPLGSTVFIQQLIVISLVI